MFRNYHNIKIEYIITKIETINLIIIIRHCASLDLLKSLIFIIS